MLTEKFPLLGVGQPELQNLRRRFWEQRQCHLPVTTAASFCLSLELKGTTMSADSIHGANRVRTFSKILDCYTYHKYLLALLAHWIRIHSYSNGSSCSSQAFFVGLQPASSFFSRLSCSGSCHSLPGSCSSYLH